MPCDLGGRFALWSLLCFACAASAQGPPAWGPVASRLAPRLADAEDAEEPLDLAIPVGAAGYVAGAAGGVFLSYLLVPADSVRGQRYLLRVAAGVAGGTVASVAAVYVANGFRGNLALMTGGALLGQAAGIGVAVGFLIVDIVIEAIYGERKSDFTGIGFAVVLGSPFYAALGADYVSDRAGR